MNPDLATDHAEFWTQAQVRTLARELLTGHDDDLDALAQHLARYTGASPPRHLTGLLGARPVSNPIWPSPALGAG